MAASLTVAQARASLWTEVDPSNRDSPEFLPLLNLASERLVTGYYWKNLCGVVEYDSATEFITLPRRYESIVGCDIHYWPQPVLSKMTEYMTSGPGRYYNMDSDRRVYNRIIEHESEVPTIEVQESIGTIRLTANSADDYGLVVRVYGNDADGNPIFTDGTEGVDLTLGAAPVTTSQQMWLTGVDKPLTKRNVDLAVVVSGTPTTLSSYEPTETNPLYRRYKVGRVEQHQQGYPAIRCLCKRRFIPLVYETDLVYPSSLSALRFAIIACRLESQGSDEIDRAQKYWASAYKVLDDSLKQQRGAIIMSVNVLQWDGAATFQVH